MPELICVTQDYRKTALARSVPGSFFQDGGWWIQGDDPDPESARICLRLFPALQPKHPELVAAARRSVADYSPISNAPDLSKRPVADDPWQRVRAAAEGVSITPHPFQRDDAQYAIDNLEAGRGAYVGHEMGLRPRQDA